MSDKVTIGRRHGSTSWSIIFGPDASPEDHRVFYNANKSRKTNRVWAETWLCGPNGFQKKRFNRDTGEDIDSSSSGSSSSSTAGSVTSSSSSSSTAALSSSSESSSSSSVNSSSSSSS